MVELIERVRDLDVKRPEFDQHSDQKVEGYVIPRDPPTKPLVAIDAVLKLLRNKEDTSQVFRITRSLTGKSMTRTFRRFARSSYGHMVMDKRFILEDYLADFDKLRAMPSGSLGRAYLAFMESGGLTPGGIKEAADGPWRDFPAAKYPEFYRYFCHLTVSHDIWHVLTGYNRDALGELCLLAFTRQQSGNGAFKLITALGAVAVKREKWSVPVLKALREAKQTGKASAWLYEADFPTLFERPLGEVRSSLNIARPVVYHSIPQSTCQSLLKPNV